MGWNASARHLKRRHVILERVQLVVSVRQLITDPASFARLLQLLCH